MAKLADRLERLEAQHAAPDEGVKHIIIRSMIRPGVDEPVYAFAYLVGEGHPNSQIHMMKGETYEEFEARLQRTSEDCAAETATRTTGLKS